MHLSVLHCTLTTASTSSESLSIHRKLTVAHHDCVPHRHKYIMLLVRLCRSHRFADINVTTNSTYSRVTVCSGACRNTDTTEILTIKTFHTFSYYILPPSTVFFFCFFFPFSLWFHANKIISLMTQQVIGGAVVTIFYNILYSTAMFIWPNPSLYLRSMGKKYGITWRATISIFAAIFIIQSMMSRSRHV